MQFKLATVSLFAALAAAQSNNNNSTDDSLAELISQLPACAKSCFNSASNSAQCATTDFQCICVEKRQQFIQSIAPCVLLSNSCTDSDRSEATEIATEFCAKIYGNPSQTELAQASQAATSVLGPSSPTSSPGTPGSAAAHGSATDFALLGIALVAGIAAAL